jgi:hypothetical protein
MYLFGGSQCQKLGGIRGDNQLKKWLGWFAVAAVGWWCWAGFDHWSHRSYCLRSLGPWDDFNCGPPLPIWYWFLLAGLLILLLAHRKLYSRS